jgi:predicted Zn-dependent protease
MYSAALSEYEQALTLSKGHSMVLAMKGYTFAISGQRAEALKVLKELKARTAREYVTPMRFAVLYAALGEKDEAFKWLNTACDKRDLLVMYVKVMPFLDTLRNDQRFPILLRRLNLA